MSGFDSAVGWFKCHRAPVGAFLLGLAAIVAGAGTIYESDDLVKAAALLSLVGGTLTGAGMAKSDEFHREKLALLKTKIDRRSPDSLIPARDLQKLVANDPKGKGR